MQRIMIIGGSDTGISTLARALGEKLDLPIYHMDREVHWLPGWVGRPPEEKAPLVEPIVSDEIKTTAPFNNYVDVHPVVRK